MAMLHNVQECEGYEDPRYLFPLDFLKYISVFFNVFFFFLKKK